MSVMTMTLPYVARTRPSNRLPDPQEKLSPWMNTMTGNLVRLSSLDLLLSELSLLLLSVVSSGGPLKEERIGLISMSKIAFDNIYLGKEANLFQIVH